MMDTVRIKIAGAGGQGVLSLGLCLARAAVRDGFEVSWLPSYGPEQRGGVANCSVVISRETIASPVVRECDVLVALNRESFARFAPDVNRSGKIFVDEELVCVDRPSLIRVPAVRLAEAAGIAKAVNTVLYAAIAACDVTPISRSSFAAAIGNSLKGKPELVLRNQELFESALASFSDGRLG